MAVVAEVEELRPFQAPERGDRLVVPEHEVAAALEHQRRRGQGPDQRQRRTLGGERREPVEVRAVEAGVPQPGQVRRQLPGRDLVQQALDHSRLRQPVREERGGEVGPGLPDLDCGERNAPRRGQPCRAAAVRDAPRADVTAVDVRPRREPRLERAKVGNLARAGDRDGAAGAAVAARIVGEDRVTAADEVGLGEQVHLAAAAPQAVEHDDAWPACSRRRAVGEVQRGRDSDAVVHDGGAVRLRERGRLPGG